MGFEDVITALKSAELLGTYLIPKDFIPSVKVEVNYKFGVAAELGNVLEKGKTQEEPKIDIIAEQGARKLTYTLALLDPDAPSKGDPKWSPFLHWIQKELGAKDLVDYMGPAPPSGSGYHRYVFFVYTSPNSGEVKLETPKEERKSFGVEKWVKDNDLTLVGVNFFLTKVDE